MEAKRVLKDEGTILVAYTMNEYSVLVYGFRENHIQECLENGKLDANYRVCPSPEDLYDYVLMWINNGWVDYNIPQIYWEIGHPAADYDNLIHW